MYARVQSTVLTTVATAGVAALAAAPVIAAPQLPAPPVISTRVALTASPGLGALPLAFLRNQAQYCSVICPFVVQGVVTVPLAAATAPAAALNALLRTGNPVQALGAAAASVTGPADAAAEGIILNDVDRVVPKAFNNLEVAVVQLLRVGSAVLAPAELPGAVNTARETILAGLGQQLPGPGVPVPTETGARTLPEVVAVEAIKVSAAVAFQAGELVLLGVVQTADAGARELAHSGDPVAAAGAAVTEAARVVHVASNIVTDSVHQAATDIRSATKTSQSEVKTPTRVKAETLIKTRPAKAVPVATIKPKVRSAPRPVRTVNRAIASVTHALKHSAPKPSRNNKPKSSSHRTVHRSGKHAK